jgi:hypothetical protein
MPLEDLLRALRQRPFQPFRVYITDGAIYEVRHPDLCMAGTRSVLIGIPGATYIEPVYDRFVNIDLLHITRLEPLPPPTGGNGQTGPVA